MKGSTAPRGSLRWGHHSLSGQNHYVNRITLSLSPQYTVKEEPAKTCPPQEFLTSRKIPSESLRRCHPAVRRKPQSTCSHSDQLHVFSYPPCPSSPTRLTKSPKQYHRFYEYGNDGYVLCNSVKQGRAQNVLFIIIVLPPAINFSDLFYEVDGWVQHSEYLSKPAE